MPTIPNTTSVENKAVEVANVAAPVAAAPGSAKVVKKAVKKPAAPKVEKASKAEKKAEKAPKAEAPKAEKAVKKEGSGIRKPQERILVALNKAGEAGLTRSGIGEKALVDTAMCTEYLGSVDDAKRLANDTKHFPSLLTLGLIKYAPEHDGVTAYAITAKGKKFVESKLS